MGKEPKRLSALLSLSLLVSQTPVWANDFEGQVADKAYKIPGNQQAKGTTTSAALSVNTTIDLAGIYPENEILITTSGAYTLKGYTNQNKVKVVDGVEADLTLENVEIDLSEAKSGVPFSIQQGAKVHMMLVGNNKLRAANEQVALEVEGDLINSGELYLLGGGLLEAIGGKGEPAIRVGGKIGIDKNADVMAYAMDHIPAIIFEQKNYQGLERPILMGAFKVPVETQKVYLSDTKEIRKKQSINLPSGYTNFATTVNKSTYTLKVDHEIYGEAAGKGNTEFECQLESVVSIEDLALVTKGLVQNVSSIETFKEALASPQVSVIKLTQDITFNDEGDLGLEDKNRAAFRINREIMIDGNGHTLSAKVTGLTEEGYINADRTNAGVFFIEDVPGQVKIKNLNIYGGGRTAIYSKHKNLYLTNVTISRACYPEGGWQLGGGGGFVNYGTAYLDNCNIVRNAARHGGGILNKGGIMYVQNSSFSENRSLDSGGGGGAMENNKGSLYLNNVTFANNRSSEIGGALNNVEGHIYGVNCTLTGNITDNPIGLGGAIGVNKGSVELANSIIAYNYKKQNDTSYIRDEITTLNGGTYNLYQSYILDDKDTSSNLDQQLSVGETDGLVFSAGEIFNPRETDPHAPNVGMWRPMIKDKAIPIVENAANQVYDNGTETYFDTTENVGYKDDIGRWIALSGAEVNGETYEVESDQLGTKRSINSIGALAKGTVQDEKFIILRSIETTGGTLKGASRYGDSYKVINGEPVTVQLQAYPDSGYYFKGWRDVQTNKMLSGDAVYDLVFDRNMVVQPVFSKENYKLEFKDSIPPQSIAFGDQKNKPVQIDLNAAAEFKLGHLEAIEYSWNIVPTTKDIADTVVMDEKQEGILVINPSDIKNYKVNVEIVATSEHATTSQVVEIQVVNKSCTGAIEDLQVEVKEEEIGSNAPILYAGHTYVLGATSDLTPCELTSHQGDIKYTYTIKEGLGELEKNLLIIPEGEVGYSEIIVEGRYGTQVGTTTKRFVIKNQKVINLENEVEKLSFLKGAPYVELYSYQKQIESSKEQFTQLTAKEKEVMDATKKECLEKIIWQLERVHFLAHNNTYLSVDMPSIIDDIPVDGLTNNTDTLDFLLTVESVELDSIQQEKLQKQLDGYQEVEESVVIDIDKIIKNVYGKVISKENIDADIAITSSISLPTDHENVLGYSIWDVEGEKIIAESIDIKDKQITFMANPYTPYALVATKNVEEPSKPDETKPVEPSKPDETKPEEPSKPDETKPVEPSKPDETKPVEPSKPDETKPVEPSKPDETKPVEPGKSDEAKPVEPSKPDEDIVYEPYIIGYKDAEFKPNEGLTRAQVAAIMTRLLDDTQSLDQSTLAFKDLKQSHWYTQYLSFVIEKDIFKGYADGTFRPDKEITRYEFVAVIERTTQYNPTFIIDDKLLQKLEEFKSIRPKEVITREETVVFINRLIGRVPNKDVIDQKIQSNEWHNPFKDITPEHEHYYDIVQSALES